MNITGKVIAALPARSGVAKTSGNSWMAQQYVIETLEQYPRKICFDVFGEDKIKEFNICPGEIIDAYFDIDAHQWQDKWFNSIRAWKIERVGAAAPAPQMVAAAPQPVAPQPIEAHGAYDELPF